MFSKLLAFTLSFCSVDATTRIVLDGSNIGNSYMDDGASNISEERKANEYWKRISSALDYFLNKDPKDKIHIVLQDNGVANDRKHISDRVLRFLPPQHQPKVELHWVTRSDPNSEKFDDDDRKVIVLAASFRCEFVSNDFYNDFAKGHADELLNAEATLSDIQWFRNNNDTTKHIHFSFSTGTFQKICHEFNHARCPGGCGNVHKYWSETSRRRNEFRNRPEADERHSASVGSSNCSAPSVRGGRQSPLPNGKRPRSESPLSQSGIFARLGNSSAGSSSPKRVRCESPSIFNRLGRSVSPPCSARNASSSRALPPRMPPQQTFNALPSLEVPLLMPAPTRGEMLERQARDAAMRSVSKSTSALPSGMPFQPVQKVTYADVFAEPDEAEMQAGSESTVKDMVFGFDDEMKMSTSVQEEEE